MQLHLSERELKRLGNRVQEDYSADISDHQQRIDRFARYIRKWRNRVDPPARGEEEKPNFSVPLLQWNVFNKWADDLSKLLGDDAEIIAKPTGPSDQRLVKKIGRYMSWRVFQSMRLVNPFAVFCFRQTLFGRAFAYSPWLVDTYRIRDEEGSLREEIAYEGPGFVPLRPDDLIVPAEDVDSIHDFSHVIRRYKTTPDRMLLSEGQGLYQGISDRYEKLVEFAKSGAQRDWFGQEIRTEEDEAEGVAYDSAQSSRSSITVLEEHLRWRPLKGRRDAREDNLKERDRWEADYVVRYVPQLDWVVGVQDLMDLYPRKRKRRPFVESSLIKDGSYWSMGFGELLESIEDESTSNHRLFTHAGQLMVGPLVFFKPSSGFDPDTFRYEPGMAIPTEDPAGVKVVSLNGNLEYSVVKDQSITAMAERVTGQSDMTLGRQSDRPNAPRTARGTIALLNQGSIRASLDTTFLREDMGEVLSHFWELEQQFPDGNKRFFRVTEEEAGGLFDVRGGGAHLEADELGGRYDFDLKFATSAWSKEAEKERAIELYQIDVSNPLIATNPRALYAVTQRVHKAMGDENFADVIPEPPEMEMPRNPRDEWTLALQGEEIWVHPQDHDDFHLRDHIRRIAEEKQRGPRADLNAVDAMLNHIEEHQEQKAQKLMRQAVAESLVRNIAQNPAALQQVLAGQMGNMNPAPGQAGPMPGTNPKPAGQEPGPELMGEPL